MKVLVATQLGQGETPGDYFAADEGEIVRLIDCPDQYCRCSAFAGLESRRATTTAMVVERRDLDPDTLFEAFRRDWETQGYAEYLSAEEISEGIVGELADLTWMLATLEPGTVVGRAGWNGGICVRGSRAA